MTHWTATEIHRLMIERGEDVQSLARKAGINYRQVYDFFAGKCILTLPNIEKLLGALDHEIDILSTGVPNPAIDCLYCGARIIPVSVHSHTQCPRCHAILERCCE